MNPCSPQSLPSMAADLPFCLPAVMLTIICHLHHLRIRPWPAAIAEKSSPSERSIQLPPLAIRPCQDGQSARLPRHNDIYGGRSLVRPPSGTPFVPFESGATRMRSVEDGESHCISDGRGSLPPVTLSANKDESSGSLRRQTIKGSYGSAGHEISWCHNRFLL